MKELTEEQWRAKLSPEQFEILRLKGTEIPFSGRYVNHHEKGTYACAACGNSLFSSKTKFDSGSGWPSFYDVAVKGNVELRPDKTGGVKRIEVVCANCGGHLGHLFNDGPIDKTGQRYCVNSSALDFRSGQ